ncbi:pentapeptide repeat-containing protein [Pedobacter sp. MC2016-24]|uniref:pentapeptide repeat-containing protein n=1 Tax=Pedobacter sp. MC2016-24 TaxID=2780090 RepID=UPI001880CACC|nr:pentapeptide repeat-containing protein [Pedobacter sp. MC2016-24]MBE9598447.1 pentapeptide repeat-containing protein [Pedobacter sp. MC2016-24]
MTKLKREETDFKLLAELVRQEQLANVKVIEDFSFPFNGQKRLTKINNCHFLGEVEFDNLQFDRTLTFSNCHFDKKVNFNSCQFPSGLILLNCTFSSELLFIDPEFETLTFSGGKFHSIKFEGIINKGANSVNYLNFESGDYETVDFSCKEINAEITLKGGDFENVYFFKAIINNKFNINGDDLNIRFMIFRKCIFNDMLDLSEGNVQGILDFHIVTFNDQFIFRDKFLCESLHLSNIIAKQNVSINQDGNLQGVSLNNCDFNNNFECHYYSQSDQHLDYYFSCSLDGFIKGNVIFTDIPVTSIDVGCYNFGNILFRNTLSRLITLKNLQNYSKLTFANTQLIPESPMFIVFDSNLGNTEFVNVDFRKFKEIVIATSEVSNIILSNSILPPRIQTGVINPIFGYNIKKNEIINNDIYYRESYRQLKVAMEKQGNTHSALIYKAMEMNYLRKELKFGWDKVLLYLNYYSNKHGLSWSRGILFTLFVSYVLFISYQLSLSKGIIISPLELNVVDLKTSVATTFDSFMDFLSSFPLYKKQSEENSSWQTHLIILLSRIFIGYGVYQTINAFRKFGSK